MARNPEGLPAWIKQALEDMPCPQCDGDLVDCEPCPLGRPPPRIGRYSQDEADQGGGDATRQTEGAGPSGYMSDGPGIGLDQHDKGPGVIPDRPWRLAEHLHETAPSLTECTELSSDEDDYHATERMEQVLYQEDSVADAAWFRVRHKSTAADAVHCCPSVFELAARATVDFLTNMMTIKSFDASLRGVLRAYQPTVCLPAPHPGVAPPPTFPRGDSAADNEYCRFPTFRNACDRVLAVQPAERYELHVCWKDGCTYWWPYSARHRRGACDASTDPVNAICRQCICPQCGTPRYKRTDKGLEARQCWFIHDVLDQFLLDRELCEGIMTAKLDRDQQKATFHASSRCNRLRAACRDAGYKEEKVCNR